MSFTVNEGNAISFSKCLGVLTRGEVGGGEERWVRPRSAALAPEKEPEWKKQTEVRSTGCAQQRGKGCTGICERRWSVFRNSFS